MSKPDNSRPGDAAAFPATQWSAVQRAKSDDPLEREGALDRLATAYWKPLYKHLRWRWKKPVEDAQDLTQAFLVQMIESHLFAQYDPAKARLRTYLRTCLDRFVQNHHRHTDRQKRGGHLTQVGCDFREAEEEIAAAGAWQPATVEERFEREWVRRLFELAVGDYRKECDATGRTLRFSLFEAYDLRESETPLTYRQLAESFDIKTTDVTNHLAAARRRFRHFVLERLVDLTGSEEEYRRESRRLLGI